MDEKQVIYEELRRVASERGLIRYKDLEAFTELKLNGPGAVGQLGRLLEEINIDERDADRPMLTAIVINSESGMPGTGFFNLAKGWGEFVGADNDVARLEFWAKEVAKVHDYWAAS